MKINNLSRMFKVTVTMALIISMCSFVSYASTDVSQSKVSLENVKHSIYSDELPVASDLLNVLSHCKSSKVSFVPITPELDKLLSKLNTNGVSVVTSSRNDSVSTMSNESQNGKEFEINLYQLEKDGKLLNKDEITPLLYENPHEHNGGYSQYNVYGTMKIRIAENPKAAEWKITSVTASTVAGTQAVRTTKMHIRARNLRGVGVYPDFFEVKDKIVNNPSNYQNYTLYPNFQNYNNCEMLCLLQAGTHFQLSNGHSFYLRTDVRGSSEIPFDDWVYYDTEMGEED